MRKHVVQSIPRLPSRPRPSKPFGDASAAKSTFRTHRTPETASAREGGYKKVWYTPGARPSSPICTNMHVLLSEGDSPREAREGAFSCTLHALYNINAGRGGIAPSARGRTGLWRFTRGYMPLFLALSSVARSFPCQAEWRRQDFLRRTTWKRGLAWGG